MVNLIQSIVEDFNFDALTNHDSHAEDTIKDFLLRSWLEKNYDNEYIRKFIEVIPIIHVQKPDEDTKQFLLFFIDKTYADRKKYVVADKAELKKIIKNSKPNADLNWLDVSNIDDMSNLFRKSNFNGNISEWDVSHVTNMEGMFWLSSFNGDISKWDVSKVIIMKRMFMKSNFNGDISKWNVSNVLTMREMFKRTKFNGDISNWNVSNVLDMLEMFAESEFMGDISNWNVAKCESFSGMFCKNAEFIKKYKDLLIKKWKLDFSPEKMGFKPYKRCMFDMNYKNYYY